MTHVFTIIIIIAIYLSPQTSGGQQGIKGIWDEVRGLYLDVDTSTGAYKGHVLRKSRLVISKDRWDTVNPRPYLSKKPRIARGTYKLIINEERMKYDLTIKNKIIRGLYRIEGNLLTTCYNPRGEGERPRGFDSCVSDGHALFTYKLIEN